MTICRPSDFTFDEHLLDTFSVISYLRREKTLADEEDRNQWVHFVHRRAFRKLAGRVKMFNTRWGDSPFRILIDNFRKITFPAQQFTLSLSHRSNIVSTLKSSRITVEMLPGDNRVTCFVDDTNIVRWLALFHSLWQRLVARLLDWSKVVKNTPAESEMVTVVDSIAFLYAIRRIAEYLFSLSDLESIFGTARTFLLPLYCLSLRTIQETK